MSQSRLRLSGGERGTNFRQRLQDGGALGRGHLDDAAYWTKQGDAMRSPKYRTSCAMY